MSFTDIAATNAFFMEHFGETGVPHSVTDMRDGFASVSYPTGPEHIRPGNFVSGPTQMSLADTVAYVAVFTKIGITPMALTASLNIHFLRPCIGPDLRAEGRVVRMGKTLAVIDVRIFGKGSDEPSAVATVTYAIPKT